MIMESLYSDTHPEMEALHIQLWRQASPTHKMNMVTQRNRSAHTVALTGLRAQFPRANERELHFKENCISNWLSYCSAKKQHLLFMAIPAMQNEPVEGTRKVTAVLTALDSAGC